MSMIQAGTARDKGGEYCVKDRDRRHEVETEKGMV